MSKTEVKIRPRDAIGTQLIQQFWMLQQHYFVSRSAFCRSLFPHNEYFTTAMLSTVTAFSFLTLLQTVAFLPGRIGVDRNFPQIDISGQ
mmetsp:Transcript_14833/g.17338  ORF Transcript_14833/g.17338 Transcript_14833/m.17338 type:complete len:89 (-) Transcript_14833:13-279(-)